MLRPRYSLLTLLVLTALVAGGVKLWHGPHHVVEEMKEGIETEYMFTRNWRGERVIEGPQLFRSRLQDGRFSSTVIVYHREGKRLPWFYEIYRTPILKPVLHIPFTASGFVADCPLTPLEQRECRHLLEQERSRNLDEGVEIDEFECWIANDYLPL